MTYTNTRCYAASLVGLSALLLMAAGCLTAGSGTATALPAAGQDDGGGDASGGGGGAGGNDGAGAGGDTGGPGEDPGGGTGDPDAGTDGTGDDGTEGDPDAGTDGAGGGDVGTDGGADTDGVGDVGTDGPADGGTDGVGGLDDVSSPRVNIFVSDFTPVASSLVILTCSVQDSGGGFVTSFSFSSTAGASTITHDGVGNTATAFVTPGLATISYTCRATNEAGQGPSSAPATVTVTGG
ncbi:MAG: hypothetical protein IID40_07410 [Planctomycetes bacterium]|nr:hypothetical protein [Planctomycetota bacterium]